MAGDSEYSCLVGAAGEGEQDSPRQPYAEDLYRLLLGSRRGPYDIQVLYNTHFSGDMLWWLELTYRRSLAIGRKADWDDPHWLMLDMGGYGSGAHFVLSRAMRKNDLVLAEWALTHGASPNSDVASNPKFKLTHTLLDMAVMLGLTEFADLVRRYGGKAGTTPLSPDESFLAACMRLDRAAAERIAGEHPELLRSHKAMFEAAKRDRPDVMALLLDLGVRWRSKMATRHARCTTPPRRTRSARRASSSSAARTPNPGKPRTAPRRSAGRRMATGSR
jgi:hypothetical protein